MQPWLTPPPPRSWGRKVLLFPLTRIVLAVLLVGLALVGAALAAFILKKVFGLPPAPVVGLGTLFVVVGVLVAYGGNVWLIERRPVGELSPRWAGVEFGLGALLGMGLIAAVIGTLFVLGCYEVMGVHAAGVLIVALAGALQSGFAEEVIVRGIFFRIIEESLGTWIALTATALFFGFAHLGNPHATVLAALAIALEAGVLLGAAYVLTRRLWLAIGMHAGWNFAEGGLFGVVVSGGPSEGLLQALVSGPDWLTGGPFGPEASVVAVVLGLVLGSGFLVVAGRRGHFRRPFWRRRQAIAEVILVEETIPDTGNA